MIQHHKITKENIEEARHSCAALDQARELTPGAETWGIIYQPGNQRGQMSRWPDGRGAVSFGSDSIWGNWEGDVLVTDEEEDVYYDEEGV